MPQYKYYERRINYYETDKMSVVHHSNYARFLEECRIDFMEFHGLQFTELEERGYMIPVLELESQFVEAVRFGETIKIVIKLEKMTSAKFYFLYIIYDETMTKIKHRAKSTHCILDSSFRPVGIKRLPEDLTRRIMSMAS